jgi:hypothetical protein
MSKAALMFLSFVAGACCAFALPIGSHALAARVQAQEPKSMVIHRAVPAVPPILIHLNGFSSLSKAEQPLDGLDCKNCSFDNATFTYGGGSYQLTNCRFSGTTSVKLTGAAANALTFLSLLKAIGNNEHLSIPRSDAPIEMLAIARRTVGISFDSPYSNCGGTDCNQVFFLRGKP